GALRQGQLLMPVNIGYQESSLRDLQPYRECIGERRRRVMRSIRYHDGTVRPDLQGVRRVARLTRPADAVTDAGRRVYHRHRIPELPDEARCYLGQHVAGGRQLGIVALWSVIGAHHGPEEA